MKAAPSPDLIEAKAAELFEQHAREHDRNVPGGFVWAAEAVKQRFLARAQEALAAEAAA